MIFLVPEIITSSQLKKELQLLISQGYSYDDIISLLSLSNLPLSLNLTVLLNSMVPNQND